MKPQISSGATKKINSIQFVVCASCKKETNHKIISGIERVIDVDGYSTWEEYDIIECCGCNSISFRKCWHSDDDFYTDDETGQTIDYEHTEIYPNRVEGRASLSDAYLLPLNVKSIYKETLNSIMADYRILAAIGIRVLIEAICKDQSAKGRNLEQKIDWLLNEKILNAAGAEILHNIRNIGNASAHEVKPHSEIELATAFDVVEHLLLGVYILPQKAKRLKS